VQRARRYRARAAAVTDDTALRRSDAARALRRAVSRLAAAAKKRFGDAPMKASVPGHVFREYDIRGVAERDLSDELAHAIGRGFGATLAEGHTGGGPLRV